MNTIKIKYGLEEIISRIPGLFPYIEFDENHASTIHPATDSTVGCYGKIVCAMKVPFGVELTVGNTRIIVENTVYTYNTLMMYYYLYKDTYPNNSFIRFMDTGIGRFKIADVLPPDSGINLEECILAPEYEYYANVGRLYSEYSKIKIMCDKYLEIKEATGEINCELECLLDKYNKMGGDVMLTLYRSLIPNAEAIARLYLNEYAYDESYHPYPFNLSLNINIVSNNNDLGILNTFINYFDPDETYVEGDEVIYNDRTYICTAEVHRGPWDANNFHKISDTDSEGNETPYISTFEINKRYYRGAFVRISDYGQVYVCDLPEYVQYQADEIINIGDIYYIKEGDEYQVDDSLTLPYVVQPDDEFYHDGPQFYEGVWSTNVFKPIKIGGSLNSRLTGFRNNNHYIDIGGIINRPNTGTDWLWYYHIGDVGFYETTTDEFNNIKLISGERVNIGEYETKLMAYGDIIKDITRVTDNRTITFTYVIGCHFKARYLHYYEDDDNNPHYCYGDFEYDEDDSHGVMYTEVYKYSAGGDIDRMTEDDFNDYITLNRPITEVYTQCEFNTSNNIRTYSASVGDDSVTYSTITTTFSTDFNKEADILCSPVTKLDYLTGVTYNPHVEDNVQIKRGNAAAWERHIKLGEIRTFDDLQTYANGGFFNLR